MRFRQFLLQMRAFVRYRVLKRRYLALSRDFEREKAKFQGEIDRLKAHYEHRVETERQKYEALLFAGVDRAYQAMKLLPITHVTHDAAEKAANTLSTPDSQPPNPEKELSGDILGFYLDSKDGFWEAEAENGRTDAEIQRLWDTEYRDVEIERAKTALV